MSSVQLVRESLRSHRAQFAAGYAVQPRVKDVTSATSVRRIEPADFDWDSSPAAAGVRRTVAEATTADGSSPLDEAALLSLRHTGLASSALWVADLSGPGGAIATPAPDNSGPDSSVGFALADAPAGAPGDVEVNLVVSPAERGRGAGGVLARTVLDAYPEAILSAWSHGNHPAAAALAADLGFARVRDLWVMRRPMDEPLPEPTTSGRFVVRPFEPGRDEDAFLAVNAASFAGHPEQGGMTRADLDRRMAEDWFDPAGFLLAEAPGGELLGFHWTKVHPGDPAYGEVYVVGVSPEAQGMGLGKVLTLAGLQHLASRGLGEVILYVESDNAAAVAVYRGLGFTHPDADTHVMYRRDSPAKP